MKIIGLCGRSGSGKGYVSKKFLSFGALHIDTDAVYHSLLEPTDGHLSALGAVLVKEFGNCIASSDCAIDRKILAQIVFSDKKKLLRLNTLTHTAVLEEVKKMIAGSDAPFVLVDAPLLFESGFDSLCDFTICVVSDDEICVDRIMRRDGISREKAQKRLASQLRAKFLTDKCTFTVYNNDSADLDGQIRIILRETGII